MKGSQKAADVFYDMSLQALDIIYGLFTEVRPTQLWESANHAAKKTQAVDKRS
jgi:hypothetical protein